MHRPQPLQNSGNRNGFGRRTSDVVPIRHVHQAMRVPGGVPEIRQSASGAHQRATGSSASPPAWRPSTPRSTRRPRPRSAAGRHAKGRTAHRTAHDEGSGHPALRIYAWTRASGGARRDQQRDVRGGRGERGGGGQRDERERHDDSVMELHIARADEVRKATGATRPQSRAKMLRASRRRLPTALRPAPRTSRRAVRTRPTVPSASARDRSRAR